MYLNSWGLTSPDNTTQSPDLQQTGPGQAVKWSPKGLQVALDQILNSFNEGTRLEIEDNDDEDMKSGWRVYPHLHCLIHHCWFCRWLIHQNKCFDLRVIQRITQYKELRR